MTDFPDRIGIGDGPMVPCRIIGMDFTPETGHTFVSGTREPDGTFRLDQVTYEGEIQGPVFPEGQTAVERMAALLDHYGVAPPAELVEAVDEDRRRVDAQTLGGLPPDCVVELEADAGTLYAALRRAGEAARQLAAGFQPMFDAVGRVGRSVGAIRSALDPELIEGRDWPASRTRCRLAASASCRCAGHATKPRRRRWRMPDPRALFGPLPHVCVGQDLTREYAIVLDAHRRAQGLPPWLKREPGSTYVPTAVEVNQAVDWWNQWRPGEPDATPEPARAEWGVRWPDRSVHPAKSRDDAYDTIDRHRAQGITSTRVVFRGVRLVVGEWQDDADAVWIGAPDE